MSVGLYDMDMSTYTLVPFNLELMKLSSYYKKKGEIVVLSPSFAPERHKLFYLRKDYDDGIYPPGLTTIPNVNYGGLAFSNNKYSPLPMDIEICKPDPYIYEKMEGIILNTTSGQREKIYKNMMEAEHCRISLDGKSIWEDYPKQFKYLAGARNIMFHDYDLGAIDGGFEEVKRILSKARTDGWATRVGMKFPVQVSDGQSLMNWSDLKPNSTFYSLRYNGVIDNDVFNDFVSVTKEKSIYSQLEYCVTASSSTENEFITKYLQQIYRQVIISRSYRIFFTLRYEDGFFFDKNWERVIDLINFYHNSYKGKPTSKYLKKIPDDTMYNFVINTSNQPHRYYSGKVMTKDEIREIFAFVREHCYPLFKDFYECNFKTLGGILT